MLIWITIWLDWCETWLARREAQAQPTPSPPPRGAKVIDLAKYRSGERAA
jgi:hypothetical protein